MAWRPATAHRSCSSRRAPTSRSARRPIAAGSIAALAAAATGPGATRYAPALKLAGSLLGESPLPRREIMLISDFQRRGWEQTPGRDDVRLPDRTVLTPVASARGRPRICRSRRPRLQRTRFENQDRVTVTARRRRIMARQPRPACRSRSRWTGDRFRRCRPMSRQTERQRDVRAVYNRVAQHARNDSNCPRTTSRATTRSISCVSPSEPVKVVRRRTAGAERESAVSRARAVDRRSSARRPDRADDRRRLGCRPAPCVGRDRQRRAGAGRARDSAGQVRERWRRAARRGGSARLVAVERGRRSARASGGGPRSHGGHAVAPRRARVCASGVRSVPRAAKRRFLGSALLRLPGCGPRAGAGARAIRRRIAGLDGAAIAARDGPCCGCRRSIWNGTICR